MDRLQKKCVIASAGFHLLLATILLIGPAFVAPKSSSEDLPILDFVPVKTVDALVSGGGNPNAKPPQALPEAPPTPPSAPPAQQPEPEKIKEPEPPKQTANEVELPQTDPESFEVSAKPKPRRPEVSTTPILRKRDTKAEAKARADSEAKEEARQAAALGHRIESALRGTASSIGSAVSGGTSIELKGPGGGGVPYANFLQAVKSVYQDAWIVPDGVADDAATTRASVTIARDGTVVTSHITRSSGNKEVDESVQRTLDRVRRAAPLPDDAKEDQRTVEINFNVKAKRALG